jgi:ABC-2 type transport system permease protein
MSRAIRSEALKLRTARLPWGLLGVALALTAVHAVLFDSNAGGTGHTAIKTLATATGQRQAITIPGEVLLFAAALGVIVASGEFRHNTATSTYLAIPDRVRVLSAKVITAATIGLLFGMASAAVATGIGLSFIAAKADHLVLSTATITRYAAGATLAAALLAAAGVALGTLIRSQVAAIITVFVWGLIIEQTISAVYDSARRYLPVRAAASLAGANIEAGTKALPFATAAALVAAVAVLIALIATRTTLNADIT